MRRSGHQCQILVGRRRPKMKKQACDAIGSCRTFPVFLRQLVRIDGIAVNDETTEQELSNKIDEHGPTQHHIIVPGTVGQVVAPPGRKRRKHTIVGSDLQHGNRDVSNGFECVSPVYREIVKDG